MTDDGPSIKGLFKNVVRYVRLFSSAPRISLIVLVPDGGRLTLIQLARGKSGFLTSRPQIHRSPAARSTRISFSSSNSSGLGMPRRWPSSTSISRPLARRSIRPPRSTSSFSSRLHPRGGLPMAHLHLTVRARYQEHPCRSTCRSSLGWWFVSSQCRRHLCRLYSSRSGLSVRLRQTQWMLHSLRKRERTGLGRIQTRT